MKIHALLGHFICLILGISSALFAANEYRIIVDIPSYNNKEWYAKNLESVLNQVGHTNYLAVVTDDCSPDGTGDLLEKYIKEKHVEEHVMLIKNKERRGALANHYHVIQLSKPDDIVVQLDGDDFFKTTDVFTCINELYKNQYIWWTYGVYENWPNKSMDCFSRRLLPSDGVTRVTVPFIFGPIRSYRGWFAKNIKLEDLIADFEPCLGKFFASAGDFALEYPLLEMSQAEHLYYIDSVLYTRNVATPINDFKVNKNLQEKCARAIKNAETYRPIVGQSKVAQREAVISVLIFDNQNDVHQLEQCLSSVCTNIKDFKSLIVFYNSSGLNCSPEYQVFINNHHEYRWVDCGKCQAHDAVRNTLRTAGANYVFMLDASYIIQQAVDQPPIGLKKYTELMDQTSAYTVTFADNGAKRNPHEWLQDDIYVWKFKLANPSLVKPHAFNGSLYNYSDAINVVKKLRSVSLVEFMTQWEGMQPDAKKVGLFMYPARIVHA